MLTVGTRRIRRNYHQRAARMSSESVANLMQDSIVVELLAETRRREPVAETFSFYRNPNCDLRRVLADTDLPESSCIFCAKLVLIHTRASCLAKKLR